MNFKRQREHLLPLCTIIFLWISCTSQSKDSAIELVKNIGSEKLLAEATILKENITPGAFVIPPRTWPDSFQLLAPMQVRQQESGFQLLMTKFIGQEKGLLIITAQKYTPQESELISYTYLFDGIYWYEDLRNE
ncbi:MAG: hypothetical protein AAGA18_07215 [Verrucomicrobiota bacterium]